MTQKSRSNLIHNLFGLNYDVFTIAVVYVKFIGAINNVASNFLSILSYVLRKLPRARAGIDVYRY
jgi:hypothetical protein